MVSEEHTEKHCFLVEYQLLYLKHHFVALYCVVLLPVVELSLKLKNCILLPALHRSPFLLLFLKRILALPQEAHLDLQ